MLFLSALMELTSAHGKKPRLYIIIHHKVLLLPTITGHLFPAQYLYSTRAAVFGPQLS